MSKKHTNKKNKQQAGNSVNVSKNHDMENEGRKEVNNDIDEMESILQSSLNNDKEYEIIPGDVGHVKEKQ